MQTHITTNVQCANVLCSDTVDSLQENKAMKNEADNRNPKRAISYPWTIAQTNTDCECNELTMYSVRCALRAYCQGKQEQQEEE